MTDGTRRQKVIPPSLSPTRFVSGALPSYNAVFCSPEVVTWLSGCLGFYGRRSPRALCHHSRHRVVSACSVEQVRDTGGLGGNSGSRTGRHQSVRLRSIQATGSGVLGGHGTGTLSKSGKRSRCSIARGPLRAVQSRSPAKVPTRCPEESSSIEVVDLLRQPTSERSVSFRGGRRVPKLW